MENSTSSVSLKVGKHAFLRGVFAYGVYENKEKSIQKVIEKVHNSIKSKLA